MCFIAIYALCIVYEPKQGFLGQRMMALATELALWCRANKSSMWQTLLYYSTFLHSTEMYDKVRLYKVKLTITTIYIE